MVKKAKKPAARPCKVPSADHKELARLSKNAAQRKSYSVNKKALKQTIDVLPNTQPVPVHNTCAVVVHGMVDRPIDSDHGCLGAEQPLVAPVPAPCDDLDGKQGQSATNLAETKRLARNAARRASYRKRKELGRAVAGGLPSVVQSSDPGSVYPLSATEVGSVSDGLSVHGNQQLHAVTCAENIAKHRYRPASLVPSVEDAERLARKVQERPLDYKCAHVDSSVTRPVKKTNVPVCLVPSVADAERLAKKNAQKSQDRCDQRMSELSGLHKKASSSSANWVGCGLSYQQPSVALLTKGPVYSTQDQVASKSSRSLVMPGLVHAPVVSSVFVGSDRPRTLFSMTSIIENQISSTKTVVGDLLIVGSCHPHYQNDSIGKCAWSDVASTSKPTDMRGRPSTGYHKQKVVLGLLATKKGKGLPNASLCRYTTTRGFKKGKARVLFEPIPNEPAVLLPSNPCPFCHAQKFKYESAHFCCAKGEISLAMNDPPFELEELFYGTSDEALSFQKFIRSYNNAVAFTSLGVTHDEKLANSAGTGCYCFRVQGQVHHYIHQLVPQKDRPAYLQLYYYDPLHEIEHRTQISSNFDKAIMEKLLRILHVNPYSAFFRSLHQIPDLDDATIVLRGDPSLNQNVYNKPTVDDVAVIWRDSDDPYNMGERNLVVHGHSDHWYNVKYHYGCYDPLQYPLLFPNGESGWHPSIERIHHGATNDVCKGQTVVDPLDFEDGAAFIDMEAEVLANVEYSKEKYVSVREYYAYLLQRRPKDRRLILRGKRLFQQFVVDMYIKLETQRLDYLRFNQKLIRSELYQGIIESIAIGEDKAARVGKRVILPPSFIGGPRDMRRRYLDAMALVREFGKPDIFLTMTCNPGWPEIQNELGEGEIANDRPDLIARIFKAKLEQLKHELLVREIFGPVAAHVYVIEFQKRGLPHAHFLLILMPGAKLKSADSFDGIVCAEIPSRKKQPYLYALVKKHVIHGPCGELNKKRPCVSNRKGRCKYGYPKQFQEKTDIGDNEYPLYRRRNNGKTVKVGKHTLNNQWVVPYCPYLLAKFACHMNVEVCSTIQAVKYLYKYIYKGHDRVAFTVVADENGPKVDEIDLFQQGRWVSPPEAVWRIFGFRMYGMQPPVLPLYLHLPKHHTVTFSQNANLANVIRKDGIDQTMLTEFFKKNAQLRMNKKRVYLYQDFPKHFRWDRSKKKWFVRVKKMNIGRLHHVSPLEGERYYLRILLCNIKGPVSFEDLRTVDGVIAPTFKAAAEAHGFIEPNDSAEKCLNEAALYQMPGALRNLFASLLVHFTPTNALDLLEKFEGHMSEDFCHGSVLSAHEIRGKVLGCISNYLDGMGKSLEDFGLPLPDKISRECKDEREVNEELSIPVSAGDLASVALLNRSQREAYDAIMSSVDNQDGQAYFVDGPGGTGKTFLYRCLLATVRSRKQIALATASSGVAASLLPGGRTAHCRFRLPFDLDGSPVCRISNQTGLGVLIFRTDLIIWDEAGMAHKRSIESFDLMLRDLMNCDKPFGGKVVVFGGDFRQVLPVVAKGSREDSIAASMVTSFLWSELAILSLHENMRARYDPAFCHFLMDVGNGTTQMIKKDVIALPSSMVVRASTHALAFKELAQFVFPGLSQYDAESMFQQNNAILTPKNKTVDLINSALLRDFPGSFHVYHGFDSCLDSAHQSQYEDLLHTFLPSGMPPYELRLKVNALIMLLRNINPSMGLCNGTRLICREFQSNIIIADIAVGDRKGERVFIHRIHFAPGPDEKYPILFQRVQFPVRPCFAMTINKSQGQTLDTVGLYLPEPVFSHGQLYVALSRAKVSASVKVLTAHSFDHGTPHGHTSNVVFKEILSYTAKATSFPSV